jgi:hypothetical protein
MEAKVIGKIVRGLTINTLIFALFIYVMERSQHLDSRHMCSSIIHYTLRSILDQELE